MPSLLSHTFVYSVVTITIILWLTLIIFWKILAYNKIIIITLRTSVIILCNICTLLSAFLLLNIKYEFYNSFADVVGEAPADIEPMTTNSPTPNKTNLSKNPVINKQNSIQNKTTKALAPPAWNAKKLYAEVTVPGTKSGITGHLWLNLPHDYFLPQYRKHTWPVVVAFGGYPGGTHSWDKDFRLPQLFAEDSRKGIISDAIVLQPDWQIPHNVDTECINLQNRPPVNTWLTTDLVNWLQKNFSVASSPESWATIGDSAGGYCAANIALNHPEIFGQTILFGAYFKPRFENLNNKHLILPSGSDLISLVNNWSPHVKVWMLTSKGDKASYPSSKEFAEAAQAPTTVEGYTLSGVGHRAAVWVAATPPALKWLGQQPGFLANKPELSTKPKQ